MALDVGLERDGGMYVLDLVSTEPGNAVDDYPGQTPSKVYNFMHCEAHDARREDIVLHISVPGQP
jgi:hypothetical protein